MKKIFLIIVMFLVLITLSTSVPKRISFQGKLYNTQGAPLNATVSIEIKIYTESTGGVALWTETQNSVIVSDGVFNLELGIITLLNLSFDTQYWIGINVNGDGEMSPRRKLKTVPYAFYSANSDTALSAVNVNFSGVVGDTVTKTYVDNFINTINDTFYTEAEIKNLTDNIIADSILSINVSTINGNINLSDSITGILSSGNIMDSYITNYTSDTLTGSLFITDNVGIGNLSPSYILDILGNGDEKIRLTNSTAGNSSSLMLANSGNTNSPWMEMQLCPSSTDMASYIRFNYGGGTSNNDIMVIKGNGNVGIGTSTPLDKLSVNGSFSADTINIGSGKIVTDASGKLGIGTISPSKKLHLYSTVNDQPLLIEHESSGFIGLTLKSANKAWVINNTTSGNNGFAIWDNENSAYRLIIDGTNGNIGIGNINPSYKLDVSGTGKFTGNVDLSAGLDVTGDLSVGTSDFFVDDSTGHIGINNSAPIAMLTIGSDYLSGITPSSYLTIGGGYAGTNIGDNFPITTWTFSGGGHTNKLSMYSQKIFDHVTEPWRGYGIIFKYDIDSSSNVSGPMLTLTPAGLIGMGTSNPGYKLDVSGTGRFTGNVDLSAGLDVTGNITVTGTVDGYDISTYGQYFISSAGSSGQVWTSDGSGQGYWAAAGGGSSGGWTDGGSSVYTTTSSDKVGINVTSPATALHIKAITNSSTAGLTIENYGNTNKYSMMIYNGGTYDQDLCFVYNGSVISHIADASGAYTSVSDRRLKSNIKIIGYGLNEILKLNPSEYNFIEDNSDKKYLGFIAQDIYKIIPEAVNVGGKDVKTSPWTLNYNTLIPVIVKAMQEQQKIISAQQKKIESYKNENINLKNNIDTIKLLLEKNNIK